MYNKETDMYEGYIYKISNNVNDKVYIGQTIETIEKRFKDHISASKCENKKGVILYNAMHKYGVENFYVEELQKISCASEEELREKINKSECDYIKMYDSKRPNGYNVTSGGSSVSDSIKVKVDQYTTDGVFIATFDSIRLAQQMIGYENGNAIIECCHGRCMVAYGYVWRHHGEPFDKYDIRPNNYGRKEVDCYSLDGKFIKTYKSMGIASKELGHIDKNGKGLTSKICNCCNGLRNIAYGYVWRYKGDSFDKYKTKPKSKHCAVNQYSIDDKYITTFYSIIIASKTTNISETGIINCCKKKNKTSGGYKWFKSDDPMQPDKTKIISNETIKEVS